MCCIHCRRIDQIYKQHNLWCAFSEGMAWRPDRRQCGVIGWDVALKRWIELTVSHVVEAACFTSAIWPAVEMEVCVTKVLDIETLWCNNSSHKIQKPK